VLNIFYRISSVVTTSAVDCLDRLVCEIAYNVSSARHCLLTQCINLLLYFNNKLEKFWVKLLVACLNYFKSTQCLLNAGWVNIEVGTSLQLKLSCVCNHCCGDLTGFILPTPSWSCR